MKKYKISLQYQNDDIIESKFANINGINYILYNDDIKDECELCEKLSNSYAKEIKDDSTKGFSGFFNASADSSESLGEAVTPSTPVVRTEVVKLQAVKRLGKPNNQFETYQEVGERIQKIDDINEFKKLNIEDKPWSLQQWRDIQKQEKWKEFQDRNDFERQILFRTLANGKEIPQYAKVLTKTFYISE